jgi:hypothetical protein
MNHKFINEIWFPILVVVKNINLIFKLNLQLHYHDKKHELELESGLDLFEQV